MAPNSEARPVDPGSGLFVSFEGGEGAGKSTQVERLRVRLGRQGREVVVTREPGGSPRAEAIRALVLGGQARGYGRFAETMLFAAARADHVDATIRPALARGAVVLCDRFTDSTRVYQGAVGGIPLAAVAALESAATGGIRPTLTLVLDLPAALGLERARRRRALGQPDRFEGEGLGYHERVREAFLRIAAAEPDRCVVIDAAGSPDAVEAAIWAASARACEEGWRHGR